MWRRAGVLTVMLACGLSVACGEPPAAPVENVPVQPTPPLTVEEWRARHEESYRAQYVTIAGLHAMHPGVNRAGSAPGNDVVIAAPVPATIGQFILEPDRVRFDPAPGVDVRLRGERVTGAIVIRPDTDPDPDELMIGDVSLVVHPSGIQRMLRVRDPNGPLATGFLGFSWFPIDDQFRVTGRFIPDPQPSTITVSNTIGDRDEVQTQGVVEFTLAGQTLRLRPFTTRPNRFWFVFRDASSGVETYPAARFLYADLQPDGQVVLDFNMAYNPPCAFNPYTTCPIPLRENRLPVKLLVGEKKYPVEVKLPFME